MQLRAIAKSSPLDMLTGKGPSQYWVYVYVSTVQAFLHHPQSPSEMWVLLLPFHR